jgi:exosortase family protein XrtM
VTCSRRAAQPPAEPWSLEEALSRGRPWSRAPGIGRFLVAFVALYGLLHAGYSAVPDAWLRDVVYPLAILEPGAFVVNALTAGERVVVSDGLLRSSTASLEVVRGCDGVGPGLLLASALVAFPARWRARVAGLAYGLAFVYLLNLVRIAGLYFAAAHRPGWFLPLHSYFVPTLFVLAVVLFFARWTSASGTPPSR